MIGALGDLVIGGILSDLINRIPSAVVSFSSPELEAMYLKRRRASLERENPELCGRGASSKFAPPFHPVRPRRRKCSVLLVRSALGPETLSWEDGGSVGVSGTSRRVFF